MSRNDLHDRAEARERYVKAPAGTAPRTFAFLQTPAQVLDDIEAAAQIVLDLDDRTGVESRHITECLHHLAHLRAEVVKRLDEEPGELDQAAIDRIKAEAKRKAQVWCRGARG